jgi:hypothetical protein
MEHLIMRFLRGNGSMLLVDCPKFGYVLWIGGIEADHGGAVSSRCVAKVRHRVMEFLLAMWRR